MTREKSMKKAAELWPILVERAEKGKPDGIITYKEIMDQ